MPGFEIPPMEGAEDSPEEPVLVRNFLAIREAPQMEPELEKFPVSFEDSAYREHAFDEAKKSFDFILDKAEFIERIKQESSRENLKYLKRVRRYGLILRALYQFMDAEHKCEKNLQRFLSLLGTYNDSYKIAPDDSLRNEILENMDGIDFSIDFVDTENFKEYVADKLSRIEDLLEEQALPVNKFHYLRKRLRAFADIMQVAAAEDFGGNMHWLFHSIIELSSKLGKEHDILVQAGLTGESKYDDAVIKVDKKAASEFKRIMPFIEKACGIEK
jgi:hypothetical protein